MHVATLVWVGAVDSASCPAGVAPHRITARYSFPHDLGRKSLAKHIHAVNVDNLIDGWLCDGATKHVQVNGCLVGEVGRGMVGID